jgi:transposase
MFSVDGTVDAAVLAIFAKDILGPRLRKDDVVIWDNLSGHKMKVVTDAIEARGAKVVFLPPYSPDLNPIELLWSKLKQVIRRFAPKTARAFNRALRIAIDSITEKDIRGWFRHCGIGAQNG